MSSLECQVMIRHVPGEPSERRPFGSQLKAARKFARAGGAQMRQVLCVKDRDVVLIEQYLGGKKIAHMLRGRRR